MSFVEGVKQKLEKELEAQQVNIIDESYKHAGHAGNTSGHTEGTHLVIEIVSSKFEGMGIMDQHRLVHSILKPEMDTRIHAMTLKTLCP